MTRGLTIERLAEEIAKLRIQFDPDAHREDYRGPEYEITFFDDTAGADWEWNEDREDFFGPTGFNTISQQLEELISQQQPIIKQKQEREAKEKAEREAEIERKRAAKYAEEQREKRDREEFARLSAKFAQVKP
jgi:hypothetical protein